MFRMGLPTLAVSLLAACASVTDASAEDDSPRKPPTSRSDSMGAEAAPDAKRRGRSPRTARPAIPPRAAVLPSARVRAAAPVPSPDVGDTNSPSAATGAERVARIEGASAAPPTLPPGTLDLGNGITAVANYTGEVAGNPYGGIKQGARYADQVLVGVDLDLGRLAGFEGASLHAIGTKRGGRSLTNDLLGNSVSVQEVYGAGQTYRLSYLSFQQKLFDGRVDVEVGRIPALTTFLSSPLYCNYQNNAVCGAPSSVFTDTNFTYFPAPTWGGVVRTKLTDKVFFNVGAYSVVPTVGLRPDHGTDFFARSTGFNVPLEIGYGTTFDNDVLPRHYSVGAVIDRSSYRDSVLDQDGSIFLLSGQDPVERFGRSIVFQRFDQMLWRPDPASPRGLTAFGVATQGTGGRQLIDYQFTFGLLETGLFESRPYDTIGLVASTQRYSGVGLANVRAGRAAQGLSTSNIARNQTFLELNYGLQLSPAARLTPNLQYIIDPDQLRYPYRQKPIPDTLVIGTKLSVDLFTMAGLAKGPGSL